jgi:hypothetical protein
VSAFVARYGGRCGGCSERIKPGEQVVYVDDELAHVDCEQWAIENADQPEVCTTCWLEKPCPCEDGQ